MIIQLHPTEVIVIQRMYKSLSKRITELKEKLEIYKCLERDERFSNSESFLLHKNKLISWTIQRLEKAEKTFEKLNNDYPEHLN